MRKKLEALLSRAAEVRRIAERLAVNNRRLEGLCAPCSMALLVALHSDGIAAELACGRYGDELLGTPHTWIESCGLIVDVTATQFHWNLAKVFTCPIGHAKYFPRKRFPDPGGLLLNMTPMSRAFFLDMAGVRYSVADLHDDDWLEIRTTSLACVGSTRKK